MNSNIGKYGNYRHYDLDNGIFDIDKEDFTVVIPVLNEELAIVKVIDRLRVEDYHNILVIDGYSTDNTATLAAKNGAKVINQHGVGKSGAIRTAIEHVKTPYFVVIDGDCTYDPKDIKNFFPHMKENDQIIGVRTIGRSNIPLLNRLGNWVINFSFNLLFGTNLLDVCSGMYALKTSFARTLVFKTGGFDVEVEIAAQSAKYGDISQIPINYYERVGKQKLRPFRDGINIQTSIIKLAIKHNPVFIYSSLAALGLLPAILMLGWVLWENSNGIWHPGWAIIGIVALLIGLIALSMGTTSILLKRMEQRLLKQMRES